MERDFKQTVSIRFRARNICSIFLTLYAKFSFPCAEKKTTSTIEIILFPHMYEFFRRIEIPIFLFSFNDKILVFHFRFEYSFTASDNTKYVRKCLTVSFDSSTVLHIVCCDDEPTWILNAVQRIIPEKFIAIRAFLSFYPIDISFIYILILP